MPGVSFYPILAGKFYSKILRQKSWKLSSYSKKFHAGIRIKFSFLFFFKIFGYKIKKQQFG